MKIVLLMLLERRDVEVGRQRQAVPHGRRRIRRCQPAARLEARDTTAAFGSRAWAVFAPAMAHGIADEPPDAKRRINQRDRHESDHRQQRQHH